MAPLTPPRERRRVVEHAPAPAIALGPAPGKPQADTTRWSLLLVWFMRLVALLWIALGLGAWLVVLAPGQAGGGFAALPFGLQAATVFFATFDLVAAVGLWLAAPWGGVVWLLTALAEIILTSILPGFQPAFAGALVVDGALIGIYFVLNFYAAQERDLP